MSALDQCPSTTPASESPDAIASRPRDVSGATGRTFWKSVDDLVGTREFRDFLHREFPAYASELLDGSRRHFLRVMGASLALAGAATIPGCRRPDHRIVAYNTAPEDIVPGKPLYYATAMPLPGGGCEGLLGETFEGRPTKVEGNPLHPRNRGKSSVHAQASVLDLYDPDRNPVSIIERSGGAIRPTAWEDFRRQAGGHFGAFDRSGGAGLVFVVDKATSPSRDALKARVLERWPSAAWLPYEPTGRENTLEGTRLAFGRPMREEVDFSKAKVVVSLDRDFLGAEGDVKSARDWASARYRSGPRPAPGARVMSMAGAAEMSRLYVVEADMTLTGGSADHRMPMRTRDIAGFAGALAGALMASLPGADGAGLRNAMNQLGGEAGKDPRIVRWVNAIAADLNEHRGECVVLAGERQDPAVHAIVHAINGALGNMGRTVRFRPVGGDAAASSVASLRTLSGALGSGSVRTLVMIGVNPAYDAPVDLDLGAKIASVPTVVYLGDANETAEAVCAASAGMYLPRAHYLEGWGDVEDWDGTYSVVQPMIRPLFDGHTELELLATVLGLASADGYEIVRETVSKRLGVAKFVPSTSITDPRFESAWRRCLHDGKLDEPGLDRSAQTPTVRFGDVARAGAQLAPARATEGIDVVFSACPKLHDGRLANNAWLQELPNQVTKASWDNPALISLATAKRLGLNPGRKLSGPQYNTVQMVTLKVNGRELRIPIWVQAGLADDTIVLHLGHGRRRGGRIAEGEGFDAYTVRTSDAMWVAPGASVEPARGVGPYLIANTQDHWSIEGRDVFREVDLHWWRQEGDRLIEGKDSYGNVRNRIGAERLGMESHTPANRDIYNQAPGRGSSIFYHLVDEQGRPVLDEHGRKLPPENKWGYPVQQWGMSIDLTTCTGCGACTVACQAENNIPVVGKMEVAKGREMHWIRVDRYYASDSMDDHAFESPDMVVQPVTCMHCENAPCEVVCPVNATVHGIQGTNDMAYNRCIGTRYCSNNCPYKVRRFNYFDFATKQLEGETSLDAVLPEGTNTSLVPPRLREKVSEVRSMQYNPHVTVRSRGVMEKCTYCIQRINAARIETKLADLQAVPDGFFQTACQQACPTGAIVFGDIFDYVANDGVGSAVRQAKDDPRTYAMLAYLNIHPRTSYQLRVRNQNWALLDKPPANPFEHHSHGDHHYDEGQDEHDHDEHAIRLPVLSNAGARA